jgi:hypothetical protein
MHLLLPLFLFIGIQNIFHTHANPNTSKLTLALVVILLLISTIPSVLGQQNSDKGKTVQTGLGIRYDYDSNIYNTSMSEVESWIGIVTPSILLSTAQQNYSLLYQGEYVRFYDDSADDYADHNVVGLAKFQIGSRGEINFIAAAEKGHEDRGSNQTDGFNPSSTFFPAEPDEFDRNKLEAKYHFGAKGNRGRLRFGIGGSQRDYTNNRLRTQSFDYATQFGSTGLSLLFHQRTSVVLDVVFTDIRYNSPQPGEASRDSEDLRYLLGLTWEATAKTEGSIRLGMQQRRFDDPTRENSSNASWEVDVRWSPREYSHVDFEASRENEETFAEGAFIDRNEYKVIWTHEWSRGWESTISWTQTDYKFVDSPRNQDLSEFYLGLRYPQGRLLTWEAGYSYRSRDSSLSNLVYDGNIYSIAVNIGF